MAVGMAAAVVSDPLSLSCSARRGWGGACSLLPGRRGRCERCPRPHLPASPFLPSPFSSLFSPPPAAALAGGGADTRECGLRPPSDPAPR